MSLTALAPAADLPGSLGRRIAATLLALLGAAALVGLVGWLASGTVAPQAPPRNPFGTGIREAAPAATGLGGWLLAVQSEFHRSLVAALAAVKRDGASVWPLIAFGFAYGVFHAAGPGHGKGVIASYIVASRKTLGRGILLSTGAAILQALVAVALVGILTLVLRAGAASVNAAAGAIELASFAALLAFGLVLTWRKSAAAVGAPHRHDASCGDACGHAHAVTAADASRVRGLRDSLAVIAAAGLRPCSGAIILLVFALSQGVFAVGIAAVAAMAAGTALTTGALAALAVGAKSVALRVAASRPGAGRPLAWLELAAAAFAAALGGALLLGLWGAGLAA